MQWLTVCFFVLFAFFFASPTDHESLLLPSAGKLV